MPVIRGSTHKLVAIAEVTFGTTPTTPVMKELPMVSFTPRSAQTVMKSEQLRTHPYVDRMLRGAFTHELSGEFEMQDDNHDMILENVFGGTITAKALAYADAIKGMTIESQAGGGSSKFDQFVGSYFNRLGVTAAASDTAPVRCTVSGMARVGTLDAAATIASSVTAAADNDPFVFADASLTVGAVATAVVQGNFNIEREVEPLMLWNSRLPREFIPGAVTATGTLTIPYDDDVQSTLVEGFTDAALVFTFGNIGGTIFRRFTFPKAKLIDISRPINTRGGRMQEINWEAYYNSGTTTVCTLTTD